MANAARIQLKSLAAGTILYTGTGQPAGGATANVYLHGTTTPATVYQAETGTGTYSMPLAADSNGQLPGWVSGQQDLDVVPVATGVVTQAEPVISSNAGGGGLAVGTTVTGASVSSLLVTDGSGKLASGGSTSSVVSVDSGTAPQVNAATVEVDQNVLYYDGASGKIKGKSISSGVSSFNTRTGSVVLGNADIEAAMEPGGYSADAHPWPQVAAESLLDQLRAGYNSPQLFTKSTGINEFDLMYVNGTYYMAYDNKNNVILIHASTIAGLSSATSDGQVGTGSAPSSTGRYPSIAYDGTNYHAWVWNQTSNKTDHYVASTWAGLASASVNDTWSFSNYSDAQVRWNPTDGMWYGGYTNTSANTIGMLKASTPAGLATGTDLGAIFATAPPFATQQSDPCPIFWNGRAYIAFGAYDGSSQRVAIVEVDPSQGFLPIGPSVVVVSPLETWQQANGANKVYSPIFLANPLQPGQERLYYSQNPGAAVTSGWGYVQVGPTPPDGRRTFDLLRYDGTINFDYAAGIKGTLNSSPTYGPNGLAVSGGSCASGLLAAPGPAADFTAEVVFTPTSLPGAGNFATLLNVSTSNSVTNPVIGIWIDNNVVYAEVDAAGGSLSLTGTTVLSTGTTYRVTLRRENGACALYLNAHSEATGSNSQSIASATSWAVGDNFNRATPTQPFSGTIKSAWLLGEALPLSQM